MEVISSIADDDSVAGIVASGGTAAKGGTLGKDIDEFALAFVAPLGAKDEGGGHIEEREGGKKG